ncbi:ABC transporter substrate-binding protein [Staphylococcus epidermidis]|nr:ABC transporter substrate-binding protein [Staphylococcus epidermidis]MCG2006047.1 ABC transporter substrate-binding protein [Staphylococcus epidermidis]MCG2044365.1 ABC transporter substrate-binding protein [Staphylococcus epidermidis]
MKKTVLFLLLSLVLVLTACNNSSNNNSTSKKNNSDSKETVTIKNSFETSGKENNGSDKKKISNTVKVPKNPKNAVVLDYGALDVLKELGVADKVKGLPKGENNQSLPNFLDEFKKAAPKAKVVYVGTSDDNLIKDMKRNTENLGKIYDKEDKAKKINKDLDRKISDMKDKTKDFNKKVMYLLVNEGELSTYGPGGRFGGLVFDTLGFKPADKKVSKSPHGQNINNEYINKQNPDVILAMDRGSVVGGKATTNQVLKNKVIKNVKAVKSNHIYELDPKLWYFSSGSSTTTIKQIDELNEVVEKVEK